MSWKYQDRYSQDLITLQKEHGVKVHRTSDDIMAAQLEAWDKVIAEFSAKNPFFAKVIEVPEGVDETRWRLRADQCTGLPGRIHALLRKHRRHTS